MFQLKKFGDVPVKCVDVKTGDVKWEKAGFGPGNVIRSEDKIVALSDAGELVLFAADPASYHELGRAKALEGKCWTTPVLSNGRIFFRSTTEAACYDAAAALPLAEDSRKRVRKERRFGIADVKTAAERPNPLWRDGGTEVGSRS